MRKIVLLRHAKSSWDDYGLRDHDRPLGPRGWRDMPEMTKRLKARAIFPDLILSSTALRAKQTAQLVIEGLQLSPKVLIMNESLYHASAEAILNQIRNQSNSVNVLFVVGHNPGFNDLIELLGGSIDNLPTSGQYGFTAECEFWKDLSSANAKTLFIDYPKKSN